MISHERRKSIIQDGMNEKRNEKKNEKKNVSGEVNGTEPGPLVRFTSTPPKHVVDGVMAGVLAELGGTLTASAMVTLGEEESKLTPVESLAAALAIFAIELGHAHWLMKDVRVKTLCSKHRILKEWLGLAHKSALDTFSQVRGIADCVNDGSMTDEEAQKNVWVASGAADAVNMIREMRTILHEGSGDAHRKEALELRRETWVAQSQLEGGL